MILIMMIMTMMTVTLHCTLHILMTQVKLHVQLQHLRGFIILTQKDSL